jgi:hypothetical protein
MLIGAMPLAMIAQDDDLYFVPKKKKAQVEKVKDITPVVAPQPKAKSSYEVIDGDTTKLDVIDFTEGKGIYPADTLETEDFALTKNMVRFDDYDVSDNDAFWAGYRAGRDTWMWHSPWYYGRYGWYDPWYYGSWYSYSRWYRPYYYSWYDPWFYGWYDPWYGPYYSYYGYYGWPYYRYGYAYYGGGGYRHYYGRTGNAGTIDIKGSTGHRASYRNTVTTNGARMSSLRERASSMGGNRVYTSGNTQRSASGNFSGRRGGNNNSNYNYSSPTRSSNSSYSSGSSFGGSRSSSSGGSFGGSRSSGGGGGGSRMGGRR